MKNVQMLVKIIVMEMSHGMTEFLLELQWLDGEEKAMDLVKSEELFRSSVSFDSFWTRNSLKGQGQMFCNVIPEEQVTFDPFFFFFF